MSERSVETVISNGTIVNEDGRQQADIAIDDGRIVGIGAPGTLPAGREVIDAEGQMILPGIIDVHVHFREPGMTHKEDWGTGSAAAALGGVTTVFDMPNTDPPVDTPAHFAEKLAFAEEKSIVDFGIYGLLGEHNLDQLEALAEAGVCGFKLFLGNTTGDLPCPNDGAVLEGFEILARLGLRCSIHAENSPMLFWRQNRLKAAGRNDPLAHLAARTDVVAVEALSRSGVIAEWTGARIHIVHESCAASLPYIRFFKERGVDITVETLPQYLYLAAEEMLSPGGDLIRMNPPIRQRAHQEPLWAGLKDGTIDMVSTDHAPHALSEKDAPTIWDIACGFPGVQTSLPLMLDAVAKDRMTLEDVVRTMSAAPARAFGLFGRKGVVRVGAEADLALVDPNKAHTIRARELASRGKLTPYDGWTVQGSVMRTLVRGQTVAVDGKIVGKAGSGRLVRPEMPPPAPRNTATTMQAIMTPGAQPW
ncbi:allantoinase AllB [Roseisalinus antarcticus]|uniref:allantoinase n=1 Tax=Roseisalinus antarcticus TaxID=254357 RepID=A0A1Y5SJJ7_9RHOB|nr:allantoinase AllB [Roseisalinus antarcticus]SLN42315.1 Allantoinase [Roseisalinus antarcticus]